MFRIITPHAQHERGIVIRVGVHICVCVCVYTYCVPKTFLNGTLVVDSPFQIFVVDLLSNL